MNEKSTIMSRAQYITGWLLAVAVPLLLWLVWQYVPYPGWLLAAGAVIGGYIGFILYEHAYFRERAARRTVLEQLALAGLLLVLFSYAV